MKGKMKREHRNYFEKLKEEEALLRRELSDIAVPDPSAPDAWEAKEEQHTETAELEGRAEEIEEFEDKNAVESELAHRLKEVTRAIERIENGGYGICEVCGGTIETERLEANPAAHTCKKHRDS